MNKGDLGEKEAEITLKIPLKKGVVMHGYIFKNPILLGSTNVSSGVRFFDKKGEELSWTDGDGTTVKGQFYEKKVTEKEMKKDVRSFWKKNFNLIITE